MRQGPLHADTERHPPYATGVWRPGQLPPSANSSCRSRVVGPVLLGAPMPASAREA